ncbi:MAG: hypothetical protein A3G17_05235 [Planctomycetes bacterium RIFCSPLOWO2_12_FULL_50_35]|nr:MAG: hypothetical protein A3E75_02510 [Planctomycetes bacterium RIFCSPHIGHO2_12_FULL_51_37]OHB95251.1 MAG: hypothetical protein A3I59_02650 [Planctomycetes bacterium RIFCSPLOWO2_02_FULL_50_16]OHC03978.1 MAG: hypothetical protein A3G17_05235 [Planctomycetes bacterium RIFCSPLOWO2_12_FULL_50_35]HCN19613.1 hypothetical protein [Planctomycetia bacterium]
MVIPKTKGLAYKRRLDVRRFISLFVVISLVLLSYLPVGGAEEGTLSTINLSGFKERIAENKGKVVLVNFWSPF